jgi:hypothetical protein
MTFLLKLTSLIMLRAMSLQPTDALPQRISQAAPWWIGLGITGVAIIVSSGSGPLLTCFALIGIGADADIARRLREARAAQGEALGMAEGIESPRRVTPSVVAGFVRPIHAAMYLLLLSFAWASLLHLAGQATDPATARWWLAIDLAAASVLGYGYSRLARRQE